MDDIRSRGRLPIVVGGTGMYVEAVLNGLVLPEVPANPDLRRSLEGLSLEELTGILAGMKQLHNTTDVDTVKRAVRAIEIAQYYKEHPESAVNTVPHPVKGAVTVGVDIPRDMRRMRISRRLRARLDEGMVEEVRSIMASGVAPEDLIYYGLEYKFVTEYVLGQTDYDSMVSSLEIAIHRFAKRQMTWFRGMERRGHHIHWLPYDMPADEFVDAVSHLVHI